MKIIWIKNKVKSVLMIFSYFNIRSLIYCIAIILILTSCSKDDDEDSTELFIGKWVQIDQGTGRPTDEDVYVEYEKDSIFMQVRISTAEIDTMKYFVKNSLLYFGDYIVPQHIHPNYNVKKYYFLENNQKLLLECTALCMNLTALYKRIN